MTQQEAGVEYVKVEGEEGAATLADLQWERLATQQNAGALPATRTAGEKWTAAITSLTGVFSIVVLIKGPEDISQVAGTVGRWLPTEVADGAWSIAMLVAAIAFLVLAAAAGHDRGGLMSVPFVAVAAGCVVLLFVVDHSAGTYSVRGGHWLFLFALAALALVAGGLWPRGSRRPLRLLLWTLALLCLVAGLFAAGQELALWETVVVVGLGAAVVFACISILAGARAAYGPVYPPSPASGGLLREQQRQEVGRSRTYLLVAIYAAVVAVMCIAASIAVTWVTTPDKPAPGNMLVLRHAPLPPRCGQLLFNDDKALLLKTSPKTKPEEIPWTDVRALTVVATCATGE